MNIENKKLNYLLYLVSIYITLKILIFILGDKTLIYAEHYVAVGSLFIPLWFFIGDMITEIYGFGTIIRVILIALLCQLIFSFICYGTVFIHAPQLDSINNAYNSIFIRMPRLAFASVVSVVFGVVINYYLLAKWKNIVDGKYFLLRSLCTTIVGEVIFSFIAIISQFLGKTSYLHIIEILIASITIKLMMTLLIAYPVSLITGYMKLSLGIEKEDTPPSPVELIKY